MEISRYVNNLSAKIREYSKAYSMFEIRNGMCCGVFVAHYPAMEDFDWNKADNFDVESGVSFWSPSVKITPKLVEWANSLPNLYELPPPIATQLEVVVHQVRIKTTDQQTHRVEKH